MGHDTKIKQKSKRRRILIEPQSYISDALKVHFYKKGHIDASTIYFAWTAIQQANNEWSQRLLSKKCDLVLGRVANRSEWERREIVSL